MELERQAHELGVEGPKVLKAIAVWALEELAAGRGPSVERLKGLASALSSAPSTEAVSSVPVPEATPKPSTEDAELEAVLNMVTVR